MLENKCQPVQKATFSTSFMSAKPYCDWVVIRTFAVVFQLVATSEAKSVECCMSNCGHNNLWFSYTSVGTQPLILFSCSPATLLSISIPLEHSGWWSDSWAYTVTCINRMSAHVASLVEGWVNKLRPCVNPAACWFTNHVHYVTKINQAFPFFLCMLKKGGKRKKIRKREEKGEEEGEEKRKKGKEREI